MALPQLTIELASALAQLPLRSLQREYPNILGHVLNGPEDVRSPRELHPAFYGCFDWHSSVHGHWMLVRLLRTFDLPDSSRIRSVLDQNLTADNLATEAAYFESPNRRSFERTYGWAWLLKLAEELRVWDDADAQRWLANLGPLEDEIVMRFLDFLPKQTYPIRTGVHPNTAFGLGFAHNYAVTAENEELQTLVERRSLDYFLADRDYPAGLEPSGSDFFSPSLLEADLMRRVLGPKEFAAWFDGFLASLPSGEPATLLRPPIVSDRTDPQICHLDGLSLSRAWCMDAVSRALPPTHPAAVVLATSAEKHTASGLAGVSSGDYMGEHWLASFAVYALT